MTMGERIKALRIQHGLTQEELGQKVGVQKSAIYKYETGLVVNLKRSMIEKLALALGVKPTYLMGLSDEETTIPPGFEPLPKTVKRPLVGAIACGEPITAEENIEDYVDVPEDAHCDFCLRCKGDSMIDAGIHDGDIVYIHIQPEVENGQIAAVRIDGEATLKRVFWDEQQQVLQLNPCNSSMSPMIFTGSVLETVHIEGKAVGYTHWF